MRSRGMNPNKLPICGEPAPDEAQKRSTQELLVCHRHTGHEKAPEGFYLHVSQAVQAIRTVWRVNNGQGSTAGASTNSARER